MKPIYFLSCLCFLICCSVKAADVSISEPIDISHDGWNKVVRVSNGNTLLFHFQQRKFVRVVVFDKQHKQVAIAKQDLKLLDVRDLKDVRFEGLYDIGGEPVLFLAQYMNNTETIIRIRVDANTGEIKDEKTIIASKNCVFGTHPYVLKSQAIEGYSVVSFSNSPDYTGMEIMLTNYDSKDKVTGTVPYNLSRAGYGAIHIAEANMDRNGTVLIAIESIIERLNYRKRKLVFIKKEHTDQQFTSSEAAMSDWGKLSSAHFVVNPVTSGVNVCINESTEAWSGSLTFPDLITYTRSAAYTFPNNNPVTQEMPLLHKTADDILSKSKNNPALKYYGAVKSGYTDDLGRQIVIFEQDVTINEDDVKTRFSGDLCVTAYDENSNELWSMLLPKANIRQVVLHSPAIFNGKRSENELYRSAFLNSANNHFILFNDKDENFDNILPGKAKPVDNFEHTNAVYYSINKSMQATKKYLSGIPTDSVYQPIYPGSLYFNEQDNTVAALMKYSTGSESTLRLIWSRLEE